MICLDLPHLRRLYRQTPDAGKLIYRHLTCAWDWIRPAARKVHRQNLRGRRRTRSSAFSRQCFVGDKWKDTAEFTLISMRACGGSEGHTPRAPAGRIGLKLAGEAPYLCSWRAGWDAVDPNHADVTSMLGRCVYLFDLRSRMFRYVAR